MTGPPELPCVRPGSRCVCVLGCARMCLCDGLLCLRRYSLLNTLVTRLHDTPRNMVLLVSVFLPVWLWLWLWL